MDAGLLIDSARNAVRSVDTIKKIIDISEKLLFKYLYLYLEDVFEIPDQPYFGHLRGKYSLVELNEINEYAKKHHIKVIPCIQTLAHLNCLFKWGNYRSIQDFGDTLLVSKSETYDLIRKMFCTLKTIFKDTYFNIGMDEAGMIGKGNYLNNHSYEEPGLLFYNHLLKVYQIAQEEGVSIEIWHDMVLNLSQNKLSIPNDIRIACWDYYHTDEESYESMFQKTTSITKNITFTCGAWTWTGFVPDNIYALKTASAGIKAAKKCGIDNVIISCWGDDGGECPIMSIMPGIFQIAKLISNNKLNDCVFKEITNYSIDEFMEIDYLNNIDGNLNVNPSKYALYNDPFLGTTDSAIPIGSNTHFESCYKKLEKLSKHNSYFSYLFQMYSSLAKVLSLKAELGYKTRDAYKNKSLLPQVINEYKQCIQYLSEFIKIYENCWLFENKSNGFEVFLTRTGGLKNRLEFCVSRLEKLYKGDINKIDELDEAVLDFEGKEFANFKRSTKLICKYSFNITAGII